MSAYTPPMNAYTPPMPTNSDDVIDSRDVIHWIEELTLAIEYLEDEIGDAAPDDYVSEREDLEEARENLRILTALAGEASNYAADWQYGETLIRDSYFEDYARELARDTGAINEEAGWPNGFIDWEAAADALRMDYSAVEFDGVTYWTR